MDMEHELVAYAGRDYAKPRCVVVGTFDLFDFEDQGLDALIEAAVAFRSEHADHAVEANIVLGLAFPKAGKNRLTCR